VEWASNERDPEVSARMEGMYGGGHEITWPRCPPNCPHYDKAVDFEKSCGRDQHTNTWKALPKNPSDSGASGGETKASDQANSEPLRWAVPRIDKEAIVVTFDMCSSSNIIEALTLIGRVDLLQNFLGDFKRHMAQVQSMATFRVYKFMGDGWILLYPPNTDGLALLEQLARLSRIFHDEIKSKVLSHLSSPPSTIGLTFGVDVGLLTATTIFGSEEYLGRPINIACRLQSAVKEGEGGPAYKLLASPNFYQRYLDRKAHGFSVRDATRKLRNIGDGADFACKEITLIQ